MLSKQFRLRGLLAGVAAVALGFLVQTNPAAAANFSFTGNLASDDQVQLFNFSVGASSTVTLRTWSYAGGVNAAGATIARGGFDPILALFNSTGAFIDQNDDGGCGSVAADSGSGRCWDTFLQSTLAPGDYTVSVMEYDNFAVGPNLANGFSRTGQGNFTSGFSCSSSQTSFRDVSGTSACGRDNHWAFDILGVNSAVVVPPGDDGHEGVPEPAALALMALGLTRLVVRRRA